MIQWLRLCSPSVGGPDSISGPRTRSCMSQLRVHMPQLKILQLQWKWKILWVAIQETWAQSLGWEVDLPWSRKWQPTPVNLPRKFHRQRSLESYSPWGHRVRRDWTYTHTLLWTSQTDHKSSTEWFKLFLNSLPILVQCLRIWEYENIQYPTR